MLRKVKKYLKFVVCCMLIMSLVAPSYAALSASDGSAFVTKAEFDSALADFNSRLTTFEAGINSKIDSQVTSYLDRNGIWNGKEQTWAFPDALSTSVPGVYVDRPGTIVGSSSSLVLRMLASWSDMQAWKGTTNGPSFIENNAAWQRDTFNGGTWPASIYNYLYAFSPDGKLYLSQRQYTSASSSGVAWSQPSNQAIPLLKYVNSSKIDNEAPTDDADVFDSTNLFNKSYLKSLASVCQFCFKANKSGLVALDYGIQTVDSFYRYSPTFTVPAYQKGFNLYGYGSMAYVSDEECLDLTKQYFAYNGHSNPDKINAPTNVVASITQSVCPLMAQKGTETGAAEIGTNNYVYLGDRVVVNNSSVGAHIGGVQLATSGTVYFFAQKDTTFYIYKLISWGNNFSGFKSISISTGNTLSFSKLSAKIY